VDAADWEAVTADMNDVGGALLPRLLTPTECAAVLDLYSDDSLFRATVDMTRHRYGQGEYRYFDRPYPHPMKAETSALSAITADSPRLVDRWALTRSGPTHSTGWKRAIAPAKPNPPL
jgi:hypothetical protein